MNVIDKHVNEINLDVHDPAGNFKETYISLPPILTVGNLVFGERYVEPQGASNIKNQDTGDTCEIEFKNRTGWTTKLEDK